MSGAIATTATGTVTVVWKNPGEQERRHVVRCHDFERKNAYNLYYFAAVPKLLVEGIFLASCFSIGGWKSSGE